MTKIHYLVALASSATLLVYSLTQQKRWDHCPAKLGSWSVGDSCFILLITLGVMALNDPSIGSNRLPYLIFVFLSLIFAIWNIVGSFMFFSVLRQGSECLQPAVKYILLTYFLLLILVTLGSVIVVSVALVALLSSGAWRGGRRDFEEMEEFHLRRRGLRLGTDGLLVSSRDEEEEEMRILAQLTDIMDLRSFFKNLRYKGKMEVERFLEQIRGGRFAQTPLLGEEIDYFKAEYRKKYENSPEKSNGENEPKRQILLSESALSSRECQICYEELKKQRFCLKFPVCGHEFHEECLLKWIKMKPNCPVCRRGFRQSVLEDHLERMDKAPPSQESWSVLELSGFGSFFGDDRNGAGEAEEEARRVASDGVLLPESFV